MGDKPANPGLAPAPAPAGGAGVVGAPAQACKAGSLGNLTVTVKRKTSGKPVPDAKVEIKGPSNKSGRTKKDGTVAFKGIKCGAYDVTGSKEPQATDKAKANVAPAVPGTATLLLPDPVTPSIKPADLTVLVKKSYMPTPARVEVTLKTDFTFEGTGKFERSKDSVRFFTALTAGTELKFDGKDNVFKGADLFAGKKVFAEAGPKPSAKVKEVNLTLTLESTKAPVKGPAKATATAVEATLDICRRRTKPKEDPPALPQPAGAVAPANPTDKVHAGRFIHQQDAKNSHERAMFIIRKVAPEGFAGSLKLEPENAEVQLFANEKAGSPGAAQASVTVKNSDIPKSGKQVFGEGASLSPSVRHTGFKLKISGGGLAGELDADKVKATVVNLKIKAQVPTTQSARGTNAVAPPNTHHKFESTSGATALDKNVPTVLVRNCDDVELTLEVKPAGSPAPAFTVQPNPGPKAGVPAVAVVAGKNKMKTDYSGGVAVAGSVGDASVFWNLVLVDLEIKTSQIRRNSDRIRDISSAGQLKVTTGIFDTTQPARCGMYARANVKFTAGGESSLDKFCDKVHAGIVNVLLNTTAAAQYSGGGRERERIPTVSGLPDPVIDPATAVTDLGTPVLDRGGAAATRATGGDTVFLRSTKSTPANGTTRLVETCDSPQVGFDAILPTMPPPPPPPPPPAAQRVTGNNGVNAFKIYLVAYSDDANFSYVAFGHGVWTVDYSGTVVTPAGANPTPVWTKTASTGITGAGAKLTEIKHGQEGKAAGCELRPPVYLTFIIDAR